MSDRSNSVELVPFTYDAHQVRTVVIDNEPWFVTADVCSILDITNVGNALTRLDGLDIRTTDVENSRGSRVQTKIVNESGLYDLILDSRKPEAKAFRRWITAEVLPSLRKTGRYAVAELSRSDLARMVLAAEAEREALTSRVAELEPAATAWEQLADATGDYSVREAAQLLNRAGIPTGQNRLFATLRELRWIDTHGHPYQTQIDTGRVARRTRTYDHPHTSEPTISVQVRITPKGLEWLRGYLGGDGLALEPAS